MPAPLGQPNEIPPSIEVKGLCYAFQDGSSGLQDVALSLPPASRTLLIGGMPSHLLYPFRKTLPPFQTPMQ